MSSLASWRHATNSTSICCGKAYSRMYIQRSKRGKISNNEEDEGENGSGVR